jgi:ubiquinone biosynthesis protein COQ4
MNTPSVPSARAPRAQRTIPLPTGRIQPARALRALRGLLANPDDLPRVFTIIESLSGRAPLRLLERFRTHPAGKRLLAARPELFDVLSDRDALRRLPDGSLGRAYLAFVESEGISAQGIAEAEANGRRAAFEQGTDFEYVARRMRDTHDLWHALTGYKGDLYGEAALLGFIAAQTSNPGVGVIAIAALLRFHTRDLLRLARRAYRDGQRAHWLPAVEWEELLARPLDEVRERLRVRPAPDYVPIRTSDLRAMGDLAA